MRPDDPREEFEIDPAPIWPEEDGRLEPIFLAGPLWVEFEEFEPLAEAPAQGTAEAPLLVEFEEFEPLDREPSADQPDDPPSAPRRRASAISLLGSLGVHLSALLVLISWSSAPADVSGAIPVQLVIEEAPSALDEAPPDQPVSESTNETPKADSGAVPPAAAPPVPPPQTAVAAVAQPPKPSPPPPTPPTPTPPAPKQAAAAALPNPVPAASAANPLQPAPKPAPSEARVPGSAAGRGDYLNHLVSLTRSHLDILPLSFLAGRRGRTTLSVLVLEDGTIGRIAVKRSSGYPDIDARIEQMVAAVGRFPPVPDSFQRPSVELDFDMTFPDALQH